MLACPQAGNDKLITFISVLQGLVFRRKGTKQKAILRMDFNKNKISAKK